MADNYYLMEYLLIKAYFVKYLKVIVWTKSNSSFPKYFENSCFILKSSANVTLVKKWFVTDMLTRSCLIVPRKIIVSIFDPFENNFGSKIDFTKPMKKIVGNVLIIVFLLNTELLILLLKKYHQYCQSAFGRYER